MKYGCHVELFNLPDDQGADDCVINYGDHNSCVYAELLKKPSECQYWQPITPENDRKFRHGEP